MDHIAQTTDAAADSAGIASARRESSISRWLRVTIVRRLRSYGPSVALDIVIVTTAFLAATVVRTIDSPNQVPGAVERYFLSALVIGCIYAIVSYLCGLHR